MSELALEQSARHQIYVQRYAAYLANQYDPYQKRIINHVDLWLLNYNFNGSLEGQLNELELEQEAVYQEYIDFLSEELEQLAQSEAEFQIEQIEDIEQESIAEDIIQAAIVGAWAGALAQRLIFPDSNTVITLQEYMNSAKLAQSKAVKDAIRTGILTSQDITDIRQSVTGRGGILSTKDKAKNKRMVVTSTNHTSAAARGETLKKSGVIGYEWVSVLDSRTSATCRSLDGRIFLFTDEYTPFPPAHPNCRSGISPLFTGDVKSKRSDRPSETGNVGAQSTYYGWLKTQSAQFQDDVLGPTRGKLFRNGGLTSKEFANLSVDELFRPLTLEEMRKRNPLAFETANLPPKE